MADRILLIEDDARLAAMVSDYLGEAGFRVTHAANGKSGLALHGREAFDFYTDRKVVISRWPDPRFRGVELGFPQNR